MKKLTIYRHGEYDKRLHLLPQSAYELFSQAKKLKDELGPVEAIYVSPVIRALQSAAVIQLVMQAETFKRRPQLADYNAAIMRPFAEEFAEDVRLNHPGAEHILWVTHEPNIHTLLCKDFYMGESFTVQAEAWNDIFKTDRREITTPLSRIEARTKDSNEAMEMLKAFYCDDCTDDERRMIDDRLSFFTY